MDSRQVSHRRSGSAVLAAALALAIFGPRAMARNSPVLVSKPLTNPSILAAAISASPSTRDPNTQARMRQREDKLPLSFEANRGQTNHRVKFLARGAGYMLFLTGNEAVLSLRQTKRGREEAERRDDIQKLKIGTRPSSLVAGHSPDTTEAIVRLRLAGANRRPQITGVGELPGKTNYFIGNDPAKWRTNVPTYAKVKYEDVYPGVGLVYYGNRGQLEYDFVVEPGADPRAIKLDVAVELAPPTVAPVSPPATGAGDSAATTRALQAAPLRIAANGDLLLKTGGGEIRFQKPVVYQNVAAGLSPADENHKPCPAKAGLYEPPQPCIAAGPASLSTGVAAGSADNPKTAIQNRKYLDGRYVLRGHNQVGFEVAAYDRKQPLIIDPVLIYSTYLGGEQDEGIFGIGFDPHGNIYVAGETSSPNFPIKHAFQSKLGGNYDGFVTEFDRTGTTLIYSTYLGGSNFDHCVGIAVDAEGSVYVAGYTQSTDFPIFHALQSALKGPQNAFVARLAPGGSKLVYSTYLGGSGVDGATGIAIDSSGNAYVAGGTQSTDFPVTPGAFQKLCDQGVNHGQCFGDAFASKLTASGSKLVYSTYLGGNFSDAAIDIAADSTGVAYLTGYTGSTDFPLKNPYQSTLNGMSNVFVTKLNASGAALVYSSYLGGNGFDTAQGIAIDALDNIYLAGTTTSTNFPLMHAFQSENMAQGYDGFASKFNAAGSRLVYSTYLGGTGTNLPWRIAVDSLGHASIIGFTSSADFPVVNAIQPTYAGGPTDAFVTKFGASGASLDYSTYLGGAADEYGYAIHADAAGNVWVGGSTASTDFPIVKPFQGVYGGGPYDAFLSAIAAAPLPSVRVLQGDVQNLTRSGSLSSSQGQALNARLQQAEQDLSQNNSHGAAIEVQDFVQQVKQYVTQGTLAAAVGDGLVTAAQEILGRLG